mgnify:CR=1 FL=1
MQAGAAGSGLRGLIVVGFAFVVFGGGEGLFWHDWVIDPLGARSYRQQGFGFIFCADKTDHGLALVRPSRDVPGMGRGAVRPLNGFGAVLTVCLTPL